MAATLDDSLTVLLSKKWATFSNKSDSTTLSYVHDLIYTNHFEGRGWEIMINIFNHEILAIGPTTRNSVTFVKCFAVKTVLCLGLAENKIT